MTQLFYIFFTLMAFALIIITVHIRIGAIEKELADVRRKVDRSISYGWTPHAAKRGALWPPLDHAMEDDRHD
jgi:hypothetical protein